MPDEKFEAVVRALHAREAAELEALAELDEVNAKLQSEIARSTKLLETVKEACEIATIAHGDDFLGNGERCRTAAGRLAFMLIGAWKTYEGEP